MSSLDTQNTVSVLEKLFLSMKQLQAYIEPERNGQLRDWLLRNDTIAFGMDQSSFCGNVSRTESHVDPQVY